MGVRQGRKLSERCLLQSILDVGVVEAARQLLASDGGGFNGESFEARDGGFFRSRAAAAVGGCGAPSPAAAAASTAVQPPTEDETEVKFTPPPHLTAALHSRTTVVQYKVFTDTYFDSPTARLTTSDHWLRVRDGVVELKHPRATTERAPLELRVDFYTEDRVWSAIAAALARLHVTIDPLVPAADVISIAAVLARADLAPFATLTTTRTRFALTLSGHAVHVDVDEVCFDAQHAPPGVAEPYVIGEVELVRAAPGTTPRDALGQVLSELGVPQGAAPVRGKVLEFIYRYDTPRWQALGASGLLAEKLGI